MNNLIMRLRAVSLLVALSTLPFVLRDSAADELEKPLQETVVKTPDSAESSLIQGRGGLSRRRHSNYQGYVSPEIRKVFDDSFNDANASYIIREFDKLNLTSITDPIEKAKYYNDIATKFHVRYSGEDVAALFVNLRHLEIIGNEKDPVKIAEKINEFSELVNKDLGIKINPYALAEIFAVLKEHNLFATATSPSEVSDIVRYFDDKVFKFNKNHLAQLLDCLLSTYYVSGINEYKEKADAMGIINNAFSFYTTDPANIQTMLNGLAWGEYIDGISEKIPEELAKAILEKVKQYKFSPFVSVMLARNGIDPEYANEYLEKSKTKIPYELPAGQLILFKVPVEFYLNHESHDASVVIHDYNQIKIKELLKASGVEDVDGAMNEMKSTYSHFGLAFPENYVRSYLMVKSMEGENATSENCKLKNIILFLLPGYKPGHDSSTRNDSAFMFSAFPIKDLEKAGFTVIISTYEKDFDIERIANEISGNYNCNPDAKWPLRGMVIAGHGLGNGLYTDDVPYDPGFDEKTQSSSVFDTNDVGIFENLVECFEKDSRVAIVLCSCSAASPQAKPKNLLTFASGELPDNFLIQGPRIPTVIYGARKVDELPHFIFDGSVSVRGNKAVPRK